MSTEEFEGKWDETNEKVKTKWGKLTRAERDEFGDRWQKRNDHLRELYDISEGEAWRAISLLPWGNPKAKNGPPGNDKSFPFRARP
jgi:uncharacterized protein YjbJ (UPF0337 family)